MAARDRIRYLVAKNRPVRVLGHWPAREGDRDRLSAKTRAMADGIEQSLDLHEAYQRQEMILRISTAIRTELRLDQVLEIAVAEVGKAFGVSRCAFLAVKGEGMLFPSHQYVAPGAPAGPYPDIDSARNPNVGLLLAGLPVVVPDVSEHPYLKTLPSLAQIQTRSLLSAPVVYQGEVLGAISMHQAGETRRWREEEVTCFSIIADQLAMALQAVSQFESSHRRAAELAQALEQLKSLDRLKSALLATVSHEFRTPLNTIVTYGASILDGTFGSIDPPLQAAISRVLEGADQLRHLTDQVLDASRLAAESFTLGLTEVDHGALCQRVASTFRAQAQCKGLDLVVDVPRELPLLVTDPERLEQLVRILLDNAIKFTPSGSVQLVASESGSGIATKVADTGIGIAEPFHERVFEEFFQIDAGLTRRFGGCGLGLYLAKRFVEVMGGRISLASRPGEGSVFQFWLPLELKRSGG